MASGSLFITNISLFLLAVGLFCAPFFVSKAIRTRFANGPRWMQHTLWTRLAETHDMWIWKTDRCGLVTWMSPPFL